jgi:hypothetical protein
MRRSGNWVLIFLAITAPAPGCQRFSHEGSPVSRSISMSARPASQGNSAAAEVKGWAVTTLSVSSGPLTSDSKTTVVQPALTPRPDVPPALLPGSVLNVAPVERQPRAKTRSGPMVARALYTAACEENRNGRACSLRPPDCDDSSYGHAPDYSWLSGELSYAVIRNAWRLRYSVNDEDCYGGTVTLIISRPIVEKLQSGEKVRVQGRMTNPASSDPSPSYQVDLIQPLPVH